ncbi:hypothetical protein [Pseudonocardia sp.]|uniref:hypothetical protein n=1 Tax=Pseudonocardia sp. TaxID=60912 RepID=UPI003D0FA4E2
MVFDAGTGRIRRRAATPAATALPRAPEGVAFAAWSAAFALGTLIHAWQGTQAAVVSGPVGVLTAVAAVAVLLRPTAPGRLMLLLAALLVEIVADLPDLVNHLVVVGVLGVTLIPWWLVLRLRSPEIAQDPAELYARVGPYLRLAFITTFAFAALAKLNTGFLDVAGTCAVWILESIPLVHLPAVLHAPAIYGTIALELSIPLLLLFHRTRPAAIVLGFGFHLVSAFAGHASFSGFAWSFYLLFLPPAMIAAATQRARAALPDAVVRGWVRRQARTASTLVVVAVAWAAGTLAIAALPAGLQWRAHWMTAAVVCTAWMGVCGWLLWTLRREWLPAPGPKASLRVTQPLMLLGVGLLVLTALMPYVGLKTRAALTMFSNVRTEPGQWNHLVLPEAMRVFDWQDGVVEFLGSDEPELDAAVEDYSRDRRLPLLEVRRLVEAHPGADVRYRIDGVERLASPVSADPVIGVPLSPEQEWFGAMRPYTDGPRCQH